MKECKVKDLIEFLQTLHPETSVQVLREDSSGWATTTWWTDLEIPDVRPDVSGGIYLMSDGVDLLGDGTKQTDILRLGER